MSMGEFPLQVAERCGATAVEAVAFQFDGIADPAIDLFAVHARSVGLDLVNAAVDDGDLLDADPGRRATDVDVMKRWIGRFAGVGFRHVRVNAGSPFSERRTARPPGYLVDALGDLGAYAASHGVRLLVENHGGSSSDPAWVAELLSTVGADNLGLLLDTGNFDAILTPMLAASLHPDENHGLSLDALDLSSVYDGIAALAPHAELVHMKAHWATDSGASGPIDMDFVVAILSSHGYSGPLTLEYEGVGGDPWAKVSAIIDRLGVGAR